MVRLERDLPSDVRAALQSAEWIMKADSTGNIHQVYYGVGTKRGQPKSYLEIVFVVKQKLPPSALSGVLFIPRGLSGPGFVMSTDVQERPPANISLLFPPLSTNPLYYTRAGELHRQCHDCPIPGGVQIQPDGANWVGTLGCKVVYRDDAGKLRHGAITNWHVATDVPNRTIVQPEDSKPWFARVAYSPGVKFDGTANHIDISVLDIERTDGAYAPRTHTVKPEQVTLGKYVQELSEQGLGATVARDGRTLGRLTDGKCVGIGATVRVGYGGNDVALFKDQFVVSRADGSLFSAPGDSGSKVFEYPAMKPWGLLFAGSSGGAIVAGGGSTTIVSPVEYAISEARVYSFE